MSLLLITLFQPALIQLNTITTKQGNMLKPRRAAFDSTDDMNVNVNAEGNASAKREAAASAEERASKKVKA